MPATSRKVFADESGIHDGYRCFGIGAWSLPENALATAEQSLQSLHVRYKFQHEQKWSRISTFRAGIECAVEGVRLLLESGFEFNAILVRKDTYRKWQESRREAFWVAYYQLTRHIARRGGKHHFVLDLRSDAYDKHDEVLEIITNYYLRHLRHDASISVEMDNSKRHLLVQYADVLTGAVTADTNATLDTASTLHEGKRETIERIAAFFGWDHLWYDTFPNASVNLWHFPPEGFRARPATREVRLTL